MFTNWLAERPDGSYVVWFHGVGNWGKMRYDYDIIDLRCLYGLKEVGNTAQSAIFRVDKFHDPKCSSVGGRSATGKLLSHSTYSVYVDAYTIYYRKDPCAAEDTPPPPFLHIVPASKDDLPTPRRKSGFDNLDSVVGRSILFRNGTCQAAVPLPEYPYILVRTGQYKPVEGRALWTVEYRPDPD